MNTGNCKRRDERRASDNTMIRKALDIHTVNQCNKLWGEKTFHPLVSVIDLSGTNNEQSGLFKVGFYTIIMKEYQYGYSASGHLDCDYSDGSVIFLAPGEFFEMNNNHTISGSGDRMLAFHPELIRNTCLGMHIRDYTFFSYKREENLHVSQREKTILVRCLENINGELQRPVDKHSRILVAKSIELLLDYCTRFYDRQFITRCEKNKELIRKTGQIINDYFANNTIKAKGLPSAGYCAGLLNLSTAYFTDLLKWETGQTMHEYVQSKRIEIAKKWLKETDKTISRIACSLGFSSPEYFIRFFKKITGCTPGDYKSPN